MNKAILSTVFCLCVFAGINAQKINKKYSSYSNEAGTVYFVHPQKGFKSTELPKDLEYDLTYVSTTDSVTFNCTYFSKENAIKADSMALVSSTGNRISSSTEMFFMDTYKGNQWRNRASSKFIATDIVPFYNSQTPFQVIVYSGSKQYTFIMKQGEWNKQMPIVKKIFNLIELNVGKSFSN